MPAGIQALNAASRSVQFNNVNPNFVLISKGSGTPIEEPGSSVCTMTVSVPVNTIVAYKTSSPTTLFRTGAGTVKFYQNRPVSVSQVEYFVFAEQPNVERATAGIQIWKPNGGPLCFDSDYPPFSIGSMVYGSAPLPLANCAIVPLQISKVVVDQLIGPQGNIQRVIASRYSSAWIAGSNFQVGMHDLGAWARSWTPNGGPNFASFATEIIRDQYLLINAAAL